MNGLTVSILMVIGFVAMAEAKVIHFDICGAGIRIGYSADDETTTVRQMAEEYWRDRHMGVTHKYGRVEGAFGFPYSMDKTLKEAGVKDGTTLRVQHSPRAETLIVGILAKLTFIDVDGC